MQNPYDRLVSDQMELLSRSCFREIESASIQKRHLWVSQHYKETGRPTLRRAYELLFHEYMGVPEEDVPVISESDTEIIWQSYNPCPTLEACNRLNLDTRTVCRAATEKSAQAFLSQLDPQLRFYRSYQDIRPHAPYCLERIVRVDFENMMEKAIQEAIDSRQEGNKGYGAVLVFGGQIIAKAHDTAMTEKDPSLHAEVNAIRQAVRILGDTNLSGAVLFSTCEPCPMCASLAVWSNLTAIVYGASIEETAQLGKARIMVSAKEIMEKSPVWVEVFGGILREECLRLYN